MKKVFNNFIRIFLPIITILITSCSVDQGNSVIISSSNNQNSVSTIMPISLPSVIVESIIRDSSIVESEILETKLYADVIIDNSIDDVIKQQVFEREDVQIENIIGISFDDYDEYEAYLENYSSISYELDFDAMRSMYEQAMTMFIVETTLDIAGMIVSIVTQNYIDAGIDAARLILTVGTVSIGSFINSVVMTKLGNQLGLSNEQIEYDILERNMRLFQMVNIINIPFVLYDVVNIARASYSLVSSFAKSLRKIDIYDGSKYIGTLKGKQLFSTKAADSAAEVIGSLDGSRNLVIKASGTLRHLGKVSELASTSIDINSLKKVIVIGDKIIDGKPIYNIAKNADGLFEYRKYITKEGVRVLSDNIDFIDEVGWIYRNGKAVRLIDLESGTILADFVAAINQGIDVGIDGSIKNKSVIKDGLKYYLDNAGNELAFVENGFLKTISSNPIDSNRTIGIMGDFDDIVPTWKKYIASSRLQGTEKFRKYLSKIVSEAKGRPELIEKFVPEILTKSDFDYLVKTGRLPEGAFQIHHKKGVSKFPELAGDLENMEILRVTSTPGANCGNACNLHKLLGHGDNFRNDAVSVTNLNIIQLGSSLGVLP